MPHFMLQVSPQGPVMSIAVMISNARRQMLIDAGQTIPEPQRIFGLIDTGASISGIDPSVLTALQLSPTGQVQVHTPSTQGVAASIDTYDVCIGIFAARPGDFHFISDTIQVTSTVLANQGIHALIGRDILSRCIFGYNGADGFFWLSY